MQLNRGSLCAELHGWLHTFLAVRHPTGLVDQEHGLLDDLQHTASSINLRRNGPSLARLITPNLLRQATNIIIDAAMAFSLQGPFF